MSTLGFAIAAALGNLVGALAVVRSLRRGLRVIDACLAFGAGFMLAVALLGVLPVVLRQGEGGALYVLIGYLAVHFAQHVLTPHFHFGEETHRVSRSAGISAMLGLTLHTFFDGVAIASGFLVSGELGVLGLATILGVVLTELVAPLASHGLALSAGVTIYVAASNLVPEFQAKRGWATALAFFGGAMGFFLTERLLDTWMR